jgi:hypothetical protein
MSTTATYETRTYTVGGDAMPTTVYRADDWLARKQWLGISSCGWILVALVALLLIIAIIAIVGAVNRRR